MEGSAADALLSAGMCGHTGLPIPGHLQTPHESKMLPNDGDDDRTQMPSLVTHTHTHTHTPTASLCTPSKGTCLPLLSVHKPSSSCHLSISLGYPHPRWHLPGSSLSTPSALRRPGHTWNRLMLFSRKWSRRGVGSLGQAGSLVASGPA